MSDYSINAVTRRVVYTGSAGVGPYAFSFEILDENDIAVYKNATLLTITTHYTVTIGGAGTGSITLLSAATGSDRITIIGKRALERTTDFVTAGDLFASALNEQLDSQIIMIQQLAEENKRTLRAPSYDPSAVEDGGTIDMALPAAADRASKYLAFDADGNPNLADIQSDVDEAAASAVDAAASAAAALVSQGAAASSASSASTSAGTATTQAGTATTQAGIATAQAVLTAADRVQTGLDAVDTAADAVATAADRVQTGLDAVDTAADAVATAADRVQTGLDAVATAADRVQTGLDRTAAADSAAAAAAAVGGATIFIGAWDASAGTFPGSGTAQKGSYYSVSVAGTVGGILFDIGDQILAIVNNASTTTYASNWIRAQGLVSLADITGALGYTPQAQDAELTAIAGLASAANSFPYFTGSGTADLAGITLVSRGLIAQNTTALMRTVGLGFTTTGDALATAASASAARTTLGLGSAAVETASVIAGSIVNLELSYSSTTVFGISAGMAVDSTRADVLKSASAFTKSTSAWAVGTGSGALDTGAIAANTWYHAYIIKRSDTGVTDFLISTSASSPTMPASYDYKRRIGSLKTNGSSQFTNFFQRGDRFTWVVPVEDVAVATHSTTASTRTLASVPLGIECVADLFITTYAASTPLWSMFTHPSQTDTAPNTTLMFSFQSAAWAYGTGQFSLPVNSSQALRTRSSIDNSLLYIIVNGWIDYRGRV